MKTVQNTDIYSEVRNRTGIPKTVVKLVITALCQIIMESLKNGIRVRLRDFGIFHLKERRGRKITTTIHGEEITIVHPEGRYVRFKPTPFFRKLVRTKKP